jgi:hypothetical protein
MHKDEPQALLLRGHAVLFGLASIGGEVHVMYFHAHCVNERRKKEEWGMRNEE